MSELRRYTSGEVKEQGADRSKLQIDGETSKLITSSRGDWSSLFEKAVKSGAYKHPAEITWES